MPTTLNSGLQLPDKGSVDWYSSMQTNYNLLDNHLENTDIHVTAEDKANWNNKQGSLSQAQLDAIAQVATNTSDITALQSGKANTSHTHSSSDITDIGDYATKQYVDNSISGLVDSAPNALDTLNELAAALNDDANFATTVATALGNKANSADLATVATSGSYNDLSNKPTINDSTITIQKNGSTVDTFTTNGSAKTINIPVPTKTSDLTNDSNFVDTSNSAVASGITSAKVTSYDAHIADNNIHVTTADKNKWNNTYVLRYSSSSVTDNSTIAYSTLDNTDNVKTGDKVIDVDGKIFSVVSVDTANQTVTVGSALIDLALDANVVHTSGNETISGTKTFLDVPIPFKSSTAELGVTGGNTKVIFTDKNLLNLAGITFGNYGSSKLSYCRFHIYDKDSNNQEIENFIEFSYVNNNQIAYFRPNKSNFATLGTVNNRWSKAYADEYYYGSNNVEFSTKFVTTDTAQTISGSKIFTATGYIYNPDDTGNTPNLVFKSSKAIKGDVSGSNADSTRLSHLDKNNNQLSYIQFRKATNGGNDISFYCSTIDGDNQVIDSAISFYKLVDGSSALRSLRDNEVSLGDSSNKWKDVRTYQINGLNPSVLSLPSQTYVDISSYFTNTGTGEFNTYTASSNGWIFLRLGTISSCQAQVLNSSDNTLWGTSSSGSVEMLMIPILSGLKLQTQWATGSTVTIAIARFYPCQGNV